MNVTSLCSWTRTTRRCESLSEITYLALSAVEVHLVRRDHPTCDGQRSDGSLRFPPQATAYILDVVLH